MGRRGKAAAALAAGLMVLAACSSSKKATTTPTTTAGAAAATTSGPTTSGVPAPQGSGPGVTLPTVNPPAVTGNTTTGITPTEIHFGGVYYKTYYAGSDDGFNARLKRENDAGGVYGHKLVLDTMLDDNNVGDQDLTAVKTLVEQDHVFAVAPVFTGALAAASYLESAKVPFFGWSIEPRWCGLNWAFGFEGDDCDLTKAPLALNFPPAFGSIFSDGTVKNHTVAIMTEDVVSSITSSTQFADVWKGAGANVVLLDSSIPSPPAVVGDFTPYAEKALTSASGQPPDAIEIIGGFGTTVGLDKKLVQLGYKGKVIGFTDYDPRVRGTTPGIITLLQYAPFEQTEIKSVSQMITDLKAYKSDVVMSEAVASGYWTADFLIAALKKAGPNLSREALYNAINSGFTYDNGGAMDPVVWPVAHELIQVGTALVQDAGTSYKVLVPLTAQGFIKNPLLKSG